LYLNAENLALSTDSVEVKSSVSYVNETKQFQQVMLFCCTTVI